VRPSDRPTVKSVWHRAFAVAVIDRIVDSTAPGGPEAPIPPVGRDVGKGTIHATASGPPKHRFRRSEGAYTDPSGADHSWWGRSLTTGCVVFGEFDRKRGVL